MERYCSIRIHQLSDKILIAVYKLSSQSHHLPKLCWTIAVTYFLHLNMYVVYQLKQQQHSLLPLNVYYCDLDIMTFPDHHDLLLFG